LTFKPSQRFEPGTQLVLLLPPPLPLLPATPLPPAMPKLKLPALPLSSELLVPLQAAISNPKLTTAPTLRTKIVFPMTLLPYQDTRAKTATVLALGWRSPVKRARTVRAGNFQ
jgi:hypothetical protein